MTQSLRELNEARLGVFRAFAAQGKVLVVSDSTSFGVRVPEWLRKEHGTELTLRFGFKNGGLVVDAQGISETLSFKGVPHRVSIPWSAIHAMVGEDGRAWVAHSTAEGEETEEVGETEEQAPAEAARPPPVVDMARPSPVEVAPPPPDGEAPAPAPRPRPMLRLVPDPDHQQS